MRLTPEARRDIHRRYFDRVKNGETVQDIAEDYGIVRARVRSVAVRMENAKKKAPGADPCPARHGAEGG